MPPRVNVPGKTDREWRDEIAKLVAAERAKLSPGLSHKVALGKLVHANPYRHTRGYRRIERMWDTAADDAARLYRWNTEHGGR